MRITEGQLRRIIREALLTEGAMTPQDAKRERLHFKIKKRDKFAEIEVYSPHSEKWIGILLSTAEDEPWRGRAACSGAWTIEGSQAKIDGLGPLMYDLMIDVVHPHPLASDRAEVTPSAQRVWDYYHNRRPDIESMQLDDLRNTLTPVEDDNCEQSIAQIWSDDNFGDEDSWPKSPLSKAYRRRGGGTPTLDELQALGMITFI